MLKSFPCNSMSFFFSIHHYFFGICCCGILQGIVKIGVIFLWLSFNAIRLRLLNLGFLMCCLFFQLLLHIMAFLNVSVVLICTSNETVITRPAASRITKLASAPTFFCALLAALSLFRLLPLSFMSPSVAGWAMLAVYWPWGERIILVHPYKLMKGHSGWRCRRGRLFHSCI